MSLTEAYCDWFEALAPEIAKELAIMLMQLFPGEQLRPNLVTSDITDGFVPRLKRLSRDPMQDAGCALTLGSLTDFIFLERGNPESWEQNEALLGLLEQTQSMLAAPESEPGADLAEWISGNKLRYPLRARQWLKAEETWRPLRSGKLSSEEINKTLKSGMLGLPPQ